MWNVKSDTHLRPTYIQREIASRFDHVSDALISLQWLRVPERIWSKIAVLVYMVLHGCAPSYLGPFRWLRSSCSDCPSSLRFTAPLLAAEHIRLLALRCGTACPWRLRRHCLWRLSALDSRHFCSMILRLTWHFFCLYTTLSRLDLAVFYYLYHSKSSRLFDWLSRKGGLKTRSVENSAWHFALHMRPVAIALRSIVYIRRVYNHTKIPAVQCTASLLSTQ